MFLVTFDPEKYSAVKIKFEPGENMKKVTCSIFSTGKVIVTGARTLQEIVNAYRIINKMISKNEMIEKTEKRDTFDIFMGVKFEDW
jgi:TATA-box binding protein (TBP) (component of TFIID and TFIIIB)